MNTSKLADFSEIISSIAIVITLVFLTIQMQQNTQAIQASSRQGSLDADTAYLTLSVNNPEIVLGLSKPELTDREATRIVQSLILFIRGRENDFAQYQRGDLDKATWERYQSSLVAVLRWERSRNFWNNTQNSFDPKFVREVNKILAQTPVHTVSTPELHGLLLGKHEAFQKYVNSLSGQ